MADLAALAADPPVLPTAVVADARLGHFLPYLLRRRLWAVLWPPDGGTRALYLGLLVLVLSQGAGLGLLLKSTAPAIQTLVPKLLAGLNAGLLSSALLVDFVPALRVVARPVPEHFPVSARLNVLTAFLLDLVTVRRLLLLAALLAALLVAPGQGRVLGLSGLLVLAAAALSFNVRLLVALRRWRHPLLGLHLGSLALLVGWLSLPALRAQPALGWGLVALPWLLGAVQLYWLGPYFSARYLPAASGAAAGAGQLLNWFPVEGKAYLRKAWLPLLMALVFKVGVMAATGWLLHRNPAKTQGLTAIYYLLFMPAISFTYVNNNLFGHLGPLVANELQRLGLTARLLRLYGRVVGPVVLADCLISVALVLLLLPASEWPTLARLPLGAAALACVGLWGSLYHAKPVVKVIDFTNLKGSVSQWVSAATILLAAALYFLPWWAHGLLAGLLLLAVSWPVRAVLRNDGPLRRRLWRGIGGWES